MTTIDLIINLGQDVLEFVTTLFKLAAPSLSSCALSIYFSQFYICYCLVRIRCRFCTGWSDPDNSARSLVTIAIQHRSVDPSIVAGDVQCSITLQSPVTFKFASHRGPVYCVDYSPFHRNVFISCSTDKTVRIYTVLQVGLRRGSKSLQIVPPPSSTKHLYQPLMRQRLSCQSGVISPSRKCSNKSKTSWQTRHTPLSPETEGCLLYGQTYW